MYFKINSENLEPTAALIVVDTLCFSRIKFYECPRIPNVSAIVPPNKQTQRLQLNWYSLGVDGC